MVLMVKLASILKVLEWVVMLTALGIMLYVIFVAQPRDQALLTECSQKVLCENSMLHGAVCDQYDSNFNPFDTPNPADYPIN